MPTSVSSLSPDTILQPTSTYAIWPSTQYQPWSTQQCYNSSRLRWRSWKSIRQSPIKGCVASVTLKDSRLNAQSPVPVTGQRGPQTYASGSCHLVSFLRCFIHLKVDETPPLIRGIIDFFAMFAWPAFCIPTWITGSMLLALGLTVPQAIGAAVSSLLCLIIFISDPSTTDEAVRWKSAFLASSL